MGGHEENAAAYGTKVKEKLLLDEMHELLEEPVEEMVSSEAQKRIFSFQPFSSVTRVMCSFLREIVSC